jgi:hypothetical protein
VPATQVYIRVVQPGARADELLERLSANLGEDAQLVRDGYSEALPIEFPDDRPAKEQQTAVFAALGDPGDWQRYVAVEGPG